MSITVFPHANLYKFKPLELNTTICCKAKVTFHVTKLRRYVRVDVGREIGHFPLNVRIKIKKIIITPRIVSFGRLWLLFQHLITTPIIQDIYFNSPAPVSHSYHSWLTQFCYL